LSKLEIIRRNVAVVGYLGWEGEYGLERVIPAGYWQEAICVSFLLDQVGVVALQGAQPDLAIVDASPECQALIHRLYYREAWLIGIPTILCTHEPAENVLDEVTPSLGGKLIGTVGLHDDWWTPIRLTLDPHGFMEEQARQWEA